MAQVDPFGWDPNTALLTDEDWRLLWEGTASLNRTPDAAAGETRAWSDATSGNSGKVTLTRVFELERHDVSCIEIRDFVL